VVLFARARCLSRRALKLLKVGALTVVDARLFQEEATLFFRKFIRAGQLDSWTKRRFLWPLIAFAGPLQEMEDIRLVEASQLTSSSPFAIL